MNHFDMCLLSHRKIVVLKTTIYHYNFIPKAVKKMAQIKKKIRIINFIAPVPWNRSVYNRHIVV